MDDFKSRRAQADDLSFLDDLDRGLELRPEYGGSRPAAPAPVPTPAHEPPEPERQRPLLALFPPSLPSESAASQAPTPARPLPNPPPPPSPAAPHVALNAADDDLTIDGVFDEPRQERRDLVVDDGDELTDEILGSLREKPFSDVPDLRFLFHSRSHDRAMQALLTAIGQHDACAVLTGDAGTGKTMACRAVLDQIDHRTFTSFIATSFEKMEDLLKAILTDFGVISRVDLEGGRLDAATEGELTLALHEFLLSLAQIKGFAVVVIDDAHALAQSLLDDLRGLADKHPRLLGVVFVGSRKLLAMLGQAGPGPSAAPDLLRVRLEPLAEDEVRGYVSHRITVGDTGGTGVDFDDEALASLHNVSGGVPRMINRVAGRALMIGADQGAGIVDAAVVEAALRELEMVVPEPIAKRVMYDVAVAGGLFVLMLIGAAAGAFVFRAQLQQVMSHWVAPPPAPRTPPLGVAPPLAPPAAADAPAGTR